MPNRSILSQAKICFGLILVNFIAQIPYFFHLYFRKQSLDIDIRSFLIMGVVLAVFLSGSILLFKRRQSGYWIMIVFLATEFLFYFLNNAASVLSGNRLFFQIYNPDLILKIIYSIGYMNLFVSGYFLFLLIANRGSFIGETA